MEDPGLILLISLVVGGCIFLVTLLSTDAALILLIFSMLLSPEIPLAQVPGRAVVVRFDDLLLAVIFFTWLAKLAINKELHLLRSTPLNIPLGMFLFSCVVSTCWGLINGSVANPQASFFYLLKYFEYFFLFFMVANVVRDRQQVERFLKVLCLTAALVSLYAYWQISAYGPGFRVTAPFEGTPEPNTLAGYLVVMIAVCLGVALYTRSLTQRIVLLGLILGMLPPFLSTYSRGGYAAVITMYLTACLVSTRHKPLLLGLLVIGIFAAPLMLPATVIERLAETINPQSPIRFLGMGIELSAAQRIVTWRWIFDQWKEHPILGFGITGLAPAIVDQQHALVLGELGVIGFAIYLWVLRAILVSSYRIFKTGDDPLVNGLSLGFLAGFVGLLIQSFAGNIFIIVRIMEPFWFLAAMVMVLPRLDSRRITAE